MTDKPRTVEELIAGIATRSEGIVTREELRAGGVTRHQIADRRRKGALIEKHRGVYRAGHRAPGVKADYMAAVKAGGAQALLAGHAATYLWRLVEGPAPPPEITAPTERRIPGVIIHRCRGLDHRDATEFRGIPITTVPRTIVDVAASTSEDDLARLCHEANVRYGMTPAQIERVLARRPNAPGARKLRRVIHGDVHITLSKLEARFLERLREEGLPLPITNRPAGGRYIDCRWPEHHLTVELDSYRFHNSRHSWRQDRQREREAYARGDQFRRYTWDDVDASPDQMLDELQKLLVNRGPS
jgi:hypothetical protein